MKTADNFKTCRLCYTRNVSVQNIMTLLHLYTNTFTNLVSSFYFFLLFIF